MKHRMGKREFKRYVARLEEFAHLAAIGVDRVRRGEVTRERWLADFQEVARAYCGRVLVTEFPTDAVTSEFGRRAVVGMPGWLSGKCLDIDCVLEEPPYSVTWLESPVPPAWMREGTSASKNVFTR